MPFPLNWYEIELWPEQACADTRGAAAPTNGRKIAAANMNCS